MMNKFNRQKSALLVSREDAFNIEDIMEFVSNKFDATLIVEDRNRSLPQGINGWSGDYIFSYLCPWILPMTVIRNAGKAAINFHPGPPSYPGTGCYNFAIYNREAKYGVTCHHLAKYVDTGEIICVQLFPIFSNDRVADLIKRTYVYLNYLFFEVTSKLLLNNPLPKSDLYWSGEKHTKNDLDELCMLSREMSDEEIGNRVRATTFPGKPGPYFVN